MTQENSLVIFTKASQMLAEATTIQKAKELKDLALTAKDWAKRKGMGDEAVKHCQSYAMQAYIKMGEMLADTERAKPGPDQKKIVPSPDVREPPPTLSDLGITYRESSESQMLAAQPKEEQQAVINGEKKVTDVKREAKRRKVIKDLDGISEKKAKKLKGVYDVIVVDPPWPMKRMELDSRPNAVEMPYPVMDEKEMAELKIPTANNCHVWLWTTHKYLPMAFRLLGSWGLKYVCCFVWHKANAYQPIGLPKYNCEMALYARKGSPSFIDTKAFNVCFNAPSGKHSEKPQEFYDVVRRVTAGRRLDMFSRRDVPGFDGWGLEAQ